MVHKMTTQISHANLDGPKTQPQSQTELNSEQNTQQFWPSRKFPCRFAQNQLISEREA